MPLMSRFSPSTLEQLETEVHHVIKDNLGFSEPTLLQAALNCVQQGGGSEDVKSESLISEISCPSLIA